MRKGSGGVTGARKGFGAGERICQSERLGRGRYSLGVAFDDGSGDDISPQQTAGFSSLEVVAEQVGGACCVGRSVRALLHVEENRAGGLATIAFRAEEDGADRFGNPFRGGQEELALRLAFYDQ